MVLRKIEMKYFVLLICLLTGTFCKAQFMDDSLVRVHGIYEIESIIKQKATNSRAIYHQSIKWITSYNNNGLPVKLKAITLNRDSYGFDSSISVYTYQDTLEIKAEWKEYINGKVSIEGEERYAYTFDSLQRMTSKHTSDIDGKQM